jgi:hypothetical protein
MVREIPSRAAGWTGSMCVRLQGQGVRSVSSGIPIRSPEQNLSSAGLLAAANRKAASRTRSWVLCHVIYASDTFNIGFFYEKTANAGKCCKCVELYVESAHDTKLWVTEYYRKNLLVAKEGGKFWHFFATEDLKSLENTCRSVIFNL